MPSLIYGVEFKSPHSNLPMWFSKVRSVFGDMGRVQHESQQMSPLSFTLITWLRAWYITEFEHVC